MVQRVAFGNIGGGQFGLKVSEPTVDVLTATDAQLIFSTTWSASSSVHQQGNVTVPANYTGGLSVSFPTLPYIPTVVVSCQNPTGVGSTYLIPQFQSAGSGAGGFIMIGIPALLVTASNFSVAVPNPAYTPSYTFRYLVLELPC